MVAGRYRIVGLLGRGGMGEVYRADDLKLGQPVALKFLPPGLEQRPRPPGAFLNEVRTARQVTHPNVCRVYDIGEVDGQHFLSMEYVDGEDLSSLLRRIGRLPNERAVEVARQICAGLAAAHDQGILHRDLKPANVMIDGRGQVRLTDFGLAGLADAIGQDDVTSGTPAYMAPEQLPGQEVTVRSDIYALGLVLYELFTGQPAFTGRPRSTTCRQAHTQSQPSSPSTPRRRHLDPAVERTLLHCLEKDPADRPASALAVSAALPGGDPLAAALAAGETPVARTGRRGRQPRRHEARPRHACWPPAPCSWLVGGARWAGDLTITNFLPLDKTARGAGRSGPGHPRRTGVHRTGLQPNPSTRPGDSCTWGGVYDEVGRRTRSAHPLGAAARPARRRGLLVPPVPPDPAAGPQSAADLHAGQRPADQPASRPPPARPWCCWTWTAACAGSRSCPSGFRPVNRPIPTGRPLFAMAELDPARFTEDRPRYQRFMAPDLRRAWLGTRADAPDVELRVEAGAFEGRPILFNVTTAASLERPGGDPEPNRPSTGLVHREHPAARPHPAGGHRRPSSFAPQRQQGAGRPARRHPLRYRFRDHVPGRQGPPVARHGHHQLGRGDLAADRGRRLHGGHRLEPRIPPPSPWAAASGRPCSCRRAGCSAARRSNGATP